MENVREEYRNIKNYTFILILSIRYFNFWLLNRRNFLLICKDSYKNIHKIILEIHCLCKFFVFDYYSCDSVTVEFIPSSFRALDGARSRRGIISLSSRARRYYHYRTKERRYGMKGERKKGLSLRKSYRFDERRRVLTESLKWLRKRVV